MTKFQEMFAEVNETDNINESAKFIKDSMMANGKVSSRLLISSDALKNSTSEINLWVNGGSPYIFTIKGDTDRLEDIKGTELNIISTQIAIKVSKLIEKEVQKFIREYQ